MNKIILLTGSRTGSHYICNLFYHTLGISFIPPELLHSEHWDIKLISKKTNFFNLNKRYDFAKASMKYVIDNADNYIIKYCDFYEKFTPEEIIKIANQHNAKFYYLYRENVIDTFISFLIVSKYGYLDNPQKINIDNLNLDKAVQTTVSNYARLITLYKNFESHINGIIKYEDFNNTPNDLKLLGINVDNVVIKNKKIISSEVKDEILKKYNLKECFNNYITTYHEYSFIGNNINDDFKFSPIKKN
jgi:hypothetical protein